jgi:hypothetical protein
MGRPADCGFNLAMRPSDPTDRRANLKFLDACETAGLKAIIWDSHLEPGADFPQMKKVLDAVIADCSKRPALAGYYIKDEPNARLFPEIGRAHV